MYLLTYLELYAFTILCLALHSEQYVLSTASHKVLIAKIIFECLYNILSWIFINSLLHISNFTFYK